LIPIQKLLRPGLNSSSDIIPIYREVKTQRLYTWLKVTQGMRTKDGLKLTSPDCHVSVLSIDYLLNNVRLLPLLVL